MTMRLTLPRAVVALFAIAAACTNTYLYDERRDDRLPADRTLTVEGEFCTPTAGEVVRPIKILIAMDASQSMRVTDPDGTRATATVQLLDALPLEDEVSVAVMLFAGSTTAWVHKGNQPEFVPVTSFTEGDKQQLRQSILQFTVVGNTVSRDSTDFVKPLSDIYAVLNRDIANARLMRTDDTRPRYAVIFLSDGQPTINQDDELLCGDAVRRLRQLKDLADDVKVNTVNVFLPTQPIDSTICDIDGGISFNNSCRIPNLPPGSCPLLIVNQNAERLSRMADLGGGDFRDFRNNEPINFLNFQFGQTRRTFIFDKLVLSNYSAPPNSPLELADTDSDGLLDADEVTEMTIPWVADTDGDGFSDGVEVYFRGRGGNFTPNQVQLPDGGGVDPGCPPELRGVDGDCDGLLDCDEQIIGTNARKADSDDDGIPDAVEWKGRSQPSSRDLDQDPDNDRLLTGEEVTMHVDPLEADTSNLSSTAYRYQVLRNGGVRDGGQQCYSFRIDNVLLANTLPDTRDAGNPDGGAPLVRRGAGYNDLALSVSMVPSDDPTARTSIRAYRNVSTRFPVGGIRSPPDGVVRVGPDDFTGGCAPQDVVQTPGP